MISSKFVEACIDGLGIRSEMIAQFEDNTHLYLAIMCCACIRRISVKYDKDFNQVSLENLKSRILTPASMGTKFEGNKKES